MADATAPATKPKAAPRKKKAVVEAPYVDADGMQTAAAPVNWPFGQKTPEPDPDLSDMTPLDFLLQVMRDPKQAEARRMQAATIAAPYVHPKAEEKGKKAAKQEAAAAAGSKFVRPAAPPRLAAAGGKKV
ncbi:MAG: terminase small subunit [Comamonas sp.]|nr:terminase small subunit [Comamonas sp.]